MGRRGEERSRDDERGEGEGSEEEENDRGNSRGGGAGAGLNFERCLLHLPATGYSESLTAQTPTHDEPCTDNHEHSLHTPPTPCWPPVAQLLCSPGPDPGELGDPRQARSLAEGGPYSRLRAERE